MFGRSYAGLTQGYDAPTDRKPAVRCPQPAGTRDRKRADVNTEPARGTSFLGFKKPEMGKLTAPLRQSSR